MREARTVAINRDIIRDGRREFVNDVRKHRRQRAHQLLTDDLDVIRVVDRLSCKGVLQLQDLSARNGQEGGYDGLRS